MIQLTITKSPDANVLSEFKFFQNQLYIGRSNGDLCIQDPQLLRSHIMIEVVGNDLMIHPQKDVDHYLINGKRATEIRKIKIGELITIGQSEFKIVGFNESLSASKKQILDPKMTQLMNEGSDRLGVIEKLVRMSK